jgi:hypothetical protein
MRSPIRGTLVVFALLAPGVAHADHSTTEQITEQTPYTLQPHEVRLGLSSVDVGLWGHPLLERIDVGTSPVPWLIAASGARTYNVHGKFELWRDDRLSLSVGAGQMLVDFAPLGAPAQFSITPMEGYAGVRLSKAFTITAGAVYTRVRLAGGTEVGALDELGGALTTSSMQARAGIEWRVSRSHAFVLGGRMLGYQEQMAEVSETETQGGAEFNNTTSVKGDLLSLGRAWSASLVWHLSLSHFNLRAGVEYGNYTLPLVNFVMPQRGPMPIIDLYWRI